MKLKIMLLGAVLLAALLPVCSANSVKTEKIVKADNKADFAVVVTTVRSEMIPGKRFGFIDRNERDDVNRELDYMQSLFDKYGTVSQMDQSVKVDLFNHQEAVNAILSRRDNDRLVCESIAPVGSHIKRTTCRTYGTVEQERRNTQQVMDNFKHTPQFKGGN